jgi:hypothetical protein
MCTAAFPETAQVDDFARVIGYDDMYHSRDTRGEQVCELLADRGHQDAVNGGLA